MFIVAVLGYPFALFCVFECGFLCLGRMRLRWMCWRFLKEGNIVTNYHVIPGASDLRLVASALDLYSMHFVSSLIIPDLNAICCCLVDD